MGEGALALAGVVESDYRIIRHPSGDAERNLEFSGRRGSISTKYCCTLPTHREWIYRNGQSVSR